MSLAQRVAEMRKRGWLSTATAAAEAMVDRSTIYRWIGSGQLEATKVGGSRYVRRSSLTRILGPMARLEPRRSERGK